MENEELNEECDVGFDKDDVRVANAVQFVMRALAGEYEGEGASDTLNEREKFAVINAAQAILAA